MHELATLVFEADEEKVSRDQLFYCPPFYMHQLIASITRGSISLKLTEAHSSILSSTINKDLRVADNVLDKQRAANVDEYSWSVALSEIRLSVLLFRSFFMQYETLKKR